MKEARIKFTWATPARIQARWRLGLFAVHSRPTDGITNLAYLSDRARKAFQKKTVFLSLRGLLLWGGALASVVFFAGALVLLQVQQRHLHNQITYADLVLPWRWSGLDALRGRALIGQAKDRFSAGEFMPGFMLLRLGLARDPGHVQARLDLSQLYIMLRLRSQSDRVLLQAFDHGYPGLRFVVVASARIAEGDNPGLVDRFLEKARASLASAGNPAEDLRVIDEITINTRLESGRAPEALALAARVHPEGSPGRLRVEIEAALQAGDKDRAARLNGEWLKLKAPVEKTLRAAASAYRRADRHDEMQATLRRLRALAPANPRLAAVAVEENLLAGRAVEARAALEDWFFRYRANERALAELARSVARAGRDDFLARIEEVVREQGFDAKPVLLGRLLAQIEARDWDRAGATADRLRKMESRLTPSDHVMLALVTACADAGGGNQQVFIDAFARSPGSLEFDRLLLDALVARGRLDTAAQLITLVEGSYPESQYVARVSADVTARRLARAQADEAARPAAREPAAPVYADANALWTDLAALESAGKADEALRRIRAVRGASPKWLPAAEESLLLREINLALRAGDMPLLQLALRNGLRLRPESAGGALDQAVRWRGENRTTEALLVAREILRSRPDFQPALQAVAAWDPKPAVTPGGAEAAPAIGRP